MACQYTSEMKNWLFDFVHGNLDDRQVLRGFIRYYVLHDCGVADIQRDVVFHTMYNSQDLSDAIKRLKQLLESI